MTLKIELTPDQEAALEAQAAACGLQLSELARLQLLQTLPPTWLTPKEIVAELEKDKSPSVYARSGEDAATIARRLREEAEGRVRWPAGEAA